MIRVEHTPTKRSGWRRRALWIAAILIVLLALATAGFAAWALVVPAPMPEALSALTSSETVRVQSEPYLTFAPAEGAARGLIVYPGGRVDPRAYAPVAQAIASSGFQVVIVPMPLNLAVFAPGSARAVMAEYPQIDAWFIGGHSLGGAMAANYVARNPDCCAGLILWAAYPAESDDLSQRQTLPVLSVYGTLDGLATRDKIQDSQLLLPPDSRFVPIAGGNHAQFGWYGPQEGDNPATLAHTEQMRQIVDATLQFMIEHQPEP